ncbi:Ras- protein Rab-28 [Globodera pallida]|nr:Ras- protein Rab-28 [Globodera pallida]
MSTLALASDDEAGRDDQVSMKTSGVDFYSRRITMPHSLTVLLQLWDVGGHNLTSPTMLNTYIFGAQAVLFVYDVTNTQSFDNLTDWVAAAKKSRAQMEKPFCMGMIGNKTDSEHRRAVSVDRHNKFAEQNAFSAHFVAAKTGDSIELMFRQKTAAEVLGIQLTIADEELNVSVVKAQITPVDGGSQNRRKQKRGGLSSWGFGIQKMNRYSFRDWFEESADEEVVKQHPIAVVEPQYQQPSPLQVPVENGFGCFHSAPVQGQTDFLELNVPVDEMFFTSVEMGTPQLAEFDIQQQKMTISSNSKLVQEVPKKQPAEDRQHGLQVVGGGGEAVQNGAEPQQRECFYADWPPTTSRNFSTVQPLSPANKMHKQNGTAGEQQQQRHQQQLRWTTPFGENDGSHQQQYHPQQQSEYGGGQLPNFTSESDFPMTRIVVRDQSMNNVRLQPYGCSSDAIEHQQRTLLHHYTSPCSSNGQSVPLISEQQQQIVIDGEQLQQRNFSLKMNNNASDIRPTESPPKPTKKPSRPRPSASSNRKSSSSGQECSQGGGGANLDQIATMLFSNSNLATVQFDPQKAIEFSQVLEQTKLLREQEERGIDVREQLRACEARIAELVQNAMAQQGNGTTVPAQSALKKKSKPKKKAPAKGQAPNAQRIGEMLQPQMNVPSIAMASDGQRLVATTGPQPMMLLSPPEVICQPPARNVVLSTTGVSNFNKFKLYSHSELPSSSSSLPFPQPTSTSIPKMADSSTTFANSRQRKRDEEIEQQMAKEKERERLQRERERERRRARLSDAFAALRSSIPTLDYTSPFSDQMDCVKRLLPFGLFSESELSNEFQEKFDGELQRHSDFLSEQMKTLKERFQSVFITESMCKMKEEKNLLLRLDAEFERVQLQNDVEAKGGSFSFPFASSSNLLDWEYDNCWDRDRYRDISPFVSPPESPKTVTFEEEAEWGDESDGETENRTDILTVEEQREVELDFSATPAGKVLAICIPLRTYAPTMEGTELEQYLANNICKNSNGTGFCNSPSEAQLINRTNHVNTYSSSNDFQPKAALPDGPSTTFALSPADIPVKKALYRRNQNDAPPFNYDEKVVNIDADSVVKAIPAEMAFLLTSERSPDNELHEEENPKLLQGEVEKEELPFVENQQLFMKPVKLRIKLDKRSDIVSKAEEKDDGANSKQEELRKNVHEHEERGERSEKKRRKAEKKQQKRQAKLEKERMKMEQNERGAPGGKEEANPSSSHPQNGERPPPSLKISLRRLACWRGTNNDTPEYGTNSSNHANWSHGKATCLTNGGTTIKSDGGEMRPGNAGDSLKLRISKLVLNRKSHGDNGDCESKSFEHRKKGRKRKNGEQKSKSREEKEEEESPRKVPRLKIRIGSVCSGGINTDQAIEQRPSIAVQQISLMERERPSEGNAGQRPPTEAMEHCRVNSSNPSEYFGSNDNNKIQFSPCCSEESDDDELRVRTNELFSKLCQD